MKIRWPTYFFFILLPVLILTACYEKIDFIEKYFELFVWEEIKPNNEQYWEPRAGLQTAQLGNSLYLIAGRSPVNSNIPGDSIIYGDVWKSTDMGISWVEILDDAQSAGLWKNRSYFEVITKGAYLYLLGGQNYIVIPNDCGGAPPSVCPPFIAVSEFFNDVWRSKDGVHWQEMTNSAPWQGRAGLGAASFKGKLWVLAGSKNDDDVIIGGPPVREYFNDVWYSKDGSDWHQATDNAPWPARAGGVVLEKEGWLYLLGGEAGFLGPYYNDVWRTKDGENWQLVTADAGWSPRPGHKCSVLLKYFVCMGGFGFPNPMDIWVSYDGDTWVQVSDSPWNAVAPDDIRYDFDMLTIKGIAQGVQPSILTFGGDRERFDLPADINVDRVNNDVWHYKANRK